MFDLFGAEMPLAVRFFLAFLIVLGLIGAAAWAVRRFGSARLGGAVRGRQPRLAVIEYTTVDARRRLLLVRRDNVEHLVMIGGPSDIVVESTIVRAQPAAREPILPRTLAPAETVTRAIPLPEAATSPTTGWPLQPEPPGPPPRRAPRIEPVAEEPPSAPPVEPPARPQREVLTALADDLAAHVAPPSAAVTPLPRNRPARQQPAEPRTEHRAAEPRPAAQPVAEQSAADQSLAEMAQRLEAALRKPKPAETRGPAVAPPVEAVEQANEAAPAPPRQPRPVEAAAPRSDSRGKEGKALYDSLEQEMASLLGRPATKI